MLVLGIETSTPQASVTIGSEQGIIGSCTISRGAAYGEFLLPAVEFLMRQSGLTYRQLSAVAVGLGPGLFTGMRVGVTTAKTLAQAGLRAFVISGNLGQPDSVARYDLPPAEIQRHVASFIAGVSGI